MLPSQGSWLQNLVCIFKGIKNAPDCWHRRKEGSWTWRFSRFCDWFLPALHAAPQMLAKWQDQTPKGIFRWYHITFSSFSHNNNLICCLPLEPPEQTEEHLDGTNFSMMRITSKSFITSRVNECIEVNCHGGNQNDQICLNWPASKLRTSHYVTT